MKLKTKHLSILIVLCLCISSCGGAKINETSKSSESSKESVLESCKKAYSNLNTVVDAATTLMTTVEKAWYFSIYAKDKEKDPYSFAYELGFGDHDVISYEEEYAKANLTSPWREHYSSSSSDRDIIRQSFYSDSAYCVSCAISLCNKDNMLTIAEETLTATKELIKTISEIDSECKYLEELKVYYTDINSCLVFFKSPSGSYNDLKDEISSYQEKFKNHKSTLEFDLE